MTLNRLKLRPLILALLSLALVLAQAGALVHAIGHSGDLPDRAGMHSQLCGQCLSSATLLATAGGSAAFSLPHAAVALHTVAVVTSLVQRSIPRAFHSRAPPRRT